MTQRRDGPRTATSDQRPATSVMRNSAAAVSSWSEGEPKGKSLRPGAYSRGSEAKPADDDGHVGAMRRWPALGAICRMVLSSLTM